MDIDRFNSSVKQNLNPRSTGNEMQSIFWNEMATQAASKLSRATNSGYATSPPIIGAIDKSH